MPPFNYSTDRLTDDLNYMSDELERQLVLMAIEEQFRPHPLRALQAWAGKLLHALRRTTSDRHHHLAHTGV